MNKKQILISVIVFVIILVSVLVVISQSKNKYYDLIETESQEDYISENENYINEDIGDIYPFENSEELDENQILDLEIEADLIQDSDLLNSGINVGELYD